MAYPVLAPDARPCVWMSAGLIRYRLCDLDYQCDCCPLDAALRREGMDRPRQRSQEDAPPGATAPGDRKYAPGHTWVRTLSHPKRRRYSVGLDRFGAAVTGPARKAVCALPCGRRVVAGDLLCELDIGPGRVRVGVPVSGRLERFNPELRSQPGIIVRDPYGRGWIAELSRVDPAELEALEEAPLACVRQMEDLHRIRRDVALRLFRDLGRGEGLTNVGGRGQTDLRDILGGSYVELVVELIH